MISLATAILAMAVPLAHAAPGALDPSFGTGGIVRTSLGHGVDSGEAMALQADGKIVVAGSSAASGYNVFALVRYNANGTLDLTFNGTGKVTTAIGTGNDGGQALAIDSSGRIVVAGYSSTGLNSDFALARYNPDGTLDATFNGTGKVTTAIGSGVDVARAVAIDGSGRIVVAGYSHNGLNLDFALVRYNANGSLDATFNGTGKVTTAIGSGDDLAHAIAIDGSGRIVVAGSSSNGASNYFALARYNADGTLDTSFNGTGKFAAAYVSDRNHAFALAIDSGGRLVVAVWIINSDTNDFFAIVRLNANGTLDTSFNGSGLVVAGAGTIFETPYALAIDSGAHIVVAGGRYNGSNYDFSVARFNTNGTFDTSFNGTGRAVFATGPGDDIAHAVAVDTLGRLVVAGTGGRGQDFAVARLLPGGIIDTSFGDGGVATTNISDFGYGEWRAVARQSDGKLVAAGNSFNGAEYDIAVARYLPGGALDASFNGTGKVTTAIGSFDSHANAVAVDLSGRIVVAGTSVNVTNEKFALARYKPDGAPDTTFNGTGSVITSIGAEADLATALALDASGRIVVAGYSFNGVKYDFALARYNADGTLDPTFNGTGKVTTAFGTTHDQANALAIDASGRIVVAGDSFVGTVRKFAVARFNADGTLDTTFNGTGKVTTFIGTTDDSAGTLAIDDFGRIVVAGYSRTAAHTDFALVRYHPDGTLDTSFFGSGKVTTSFGGFSATARSVGIDASGAIVASGTVFNASIGGSFALARYNANGTLDTTFGNSGQVFTAIGTSGVDAAAMILQPDNKAVVAGVAYDSPTAVLARYLLDPSPPVLVFAPQVGVPLSTFITSDPVTITGVVGSVTMSVVNGQYAIGCVEPYATSPTMVSNGTQVCVRHFSSPQPGTTVTTTLIVGAMQGTFTSTTARANPSVLVATSGNPAVAGGMVTFTASVSGSFSTPIGQVAFLDGNVVLGVAPMNGAGVATFPTSTLSVGTHAITASYSGDGTYFGANSSPLDEVVLDPVSDSDGDGIPNSVELAEGRNPLAKDNDIFAVSRLFAMQQYRDFLGREADPSGLAYYTNLLDGNPALRAPIIEAFFNSPEFSGTVSPIARLYFAAFLRVPDYDGLLFQVDAYRTGTPLTVIANNFTLSPEFQATYGALTDPQYVALLYNNVLGRTASQGEIDYHVARLTGGATRGEVLAGFSESPEYQAGTYNDVYVTMMYVGMLRRAPEQAGFVYWLAYMDAGNPGINLILGFLNAPEYRSRFMP